MSGRSCRAVAIGGDREFSRVMSTSPPPVAMTVTGIPFGTWRFIRDCLELPLEKEMETDAVEYFDDPELYGDPGVV